MALNTKKISEFKAQLLKAQQELTKEIKSHETMPDLGNDTEGDLQEEAGEAEAYSAQLGLKAVHKKRLNDVNRALEKIEKKTYGICEKCGAEINDKILQLVPETHCCQKCKPGEACD